MKKREDTTKDESIAINPPLQEKINHNGFTNSPPWTQVAPPIIILVSLIMTLIATNVHFQSAITLVIFDLLICVDFGFVVLLWYKSTNTVPTCHVQLAHLEAIKKGQQFNHEGIPFFCHSCKTFTSKNCFHCKRCRRCVQFFDHHCKWLNNCIGAKNYFEFYGLIITTLILFVFGISLSAYCLSDIDVDDSSSTLVLTCSILTILIVCVPSCWLIYLICLHTYLIITKKSTIQLIMETRKKNQITPKNEGHHVFKVSNELNNKIAIKKITFPQKQQELQSSNYTNHQLIRQQRQNTKQDKLMATQPSITISRTRHKNLPPVNHKITLSFTQNNLGKCLGHTSMRKN